MGDLRIKDLVVEYSNGGEALRVIDGLDLEVTAGSLVIVLGPSGCGKSTLLSCIGGILNPTGGRIQVAWQQVVDHTAPFGRLNYWKSIFLTELSDEAIRPHRAARANSPRAANTSIPDPARRLSEPCSMAGDNLFDPQPSLHRPFDHQVDRPR